MPGPGTRCALVMCLARLQQPARSSSRFSAGQATDAKRGFNSCSLPCPEAIHHLLQAALPTAHSPPTRLVGVVQGAPRGHGRAAAVHLQRAHCGNDDHGVRGQAAAAREAVGGRLAGAQGREGKSWECAQQQTLPGMIPGWAYSAPRTTSTGVDNCGRFRDTRHTFTACCDSSEHTVVPGFREGKSPSLLWLSWV